MEEAIAPTIGFVFGLLLWSSPLGRKPGISLALGIAIAAVAGLIATVLTGEYLQGWDDLLFDMGTAALGVFAAMLVVRYVPHRYRARLGGLGG